MAYSEGFPTLTMGLIHRTDPRLNVLILNFETRCSRLAALQILWLVQSPDSVVLLQVPVHGLSLRFLLKISLRSVRMLDTIVCLGTFLSSSAVLSGLGRRWTHPAILLHLSFCGHWPSQLDATNLGATIVIAQGWCSTIFNLSPTQITCLLVISLMCVCQAETEAYPGHSHVTRARLGALSGTIYGWGTKDPKTRVRTLPSSWASSGHVLVTTRSIMMWVPATPMLTVTFATRLPRSSGLAQDIAGTKGGCSFLLLFAQFCQPEWSSITKRIVHDLISS